MSTSPEASTGAMTVCNQLDLNRMKVVMTQYKIWSESVLNKCEELMA